MLDKAKTVYWCGTTYKSVAIRLYIRNMYFVLFFPGPYIRMKKRSGITQRQLQEMLASDTWEVFGDVSSLTECEDSESVVEEASVRDPAHTEPQDPQPHPTITASQDRPSPSATSGLTGARRTTNEVWEELQDVHSHHTGSQSPPRRVLYPPSLPPTPQSLCTIILYFTTKLVISYFRNDPVQ